MRHKIKFTYCLLQYEHDPWLKERLNIGVLVFGPSADYMRLKTRSWDGRILSAYPSLERANFTEDLKQVQRSIQTFAHKALREPSLFMNAKQTELHSRSEQEAFNLAKLLSPDVDSSYRWDFGGVGLCSSLDDKLEQLFSRYVTSYDKPKTESNRSDEEVWSTFSSKLSARELDHIIEPDKTVQSDLGKVKFHASYQNGALHVIQPLSFDLTDEENIGIKAGKWASYAQSIESYSNGKVKPHFVIGRPTRDNLIPSFEKASAFLGKMSGIGNVVTEENSDQFVDTIASQIRAH
ncbi:DUF3037 domain-containing protein [Halocynthiibacter namhaensis]|uniref:DUF3037 domain-containing protein n=1 Tax=Halocynthiibacter namhaensis TaxID=1290553 RepID=UPI0005798F91|nr:DUF3037 domain-containing protein [Halocynthiibacter namhaensis]